MATTNRDRVSAALDVLRAGLAPFVERELQQAAPQGLVDPATVRRYAETTIPANRPIREWDVASLLKLMWETWNDVFRQTLGQAERSLVSELRDWRNKWAHQQPFSTDDVYRVLDSAGRLLTAVSSPQAAELDRMKDEVLRLRFEEQTTREKRKTKGPLLHSDTAGALKPWREVVSPHPDVASGRYLQAEFAADLWQVHLGEGSDEYRDPVEFFRRTYLTASLKELLSNAVRRLSGGQGDPVVQLQTNFGGGKTHSMLALYHLFSGVDPSELAGVPDILRDEGVDRLPNVRRVVLVGNRLSPGNPQTKPDGTVVRTLWGELAWQLGGREAYERIAADDERATSPGDRLRELFIDYGPCLILIDEWVAYARQLHDGADLPGGSFETQFTFAQALSESAKAAPGCVVVISLPASDEHGEDVEVGGLRGRDALNRLRNVVGRVESSWRPASAEESFEIVRRRLFQPMTDPAQFAARDAVARAFSDLYHGQSQEFPQECREAAYEKRTRDAYPIHPEMFDRLYTDWSTLLKFQRTRGVLRLMAAVIHSLWEQGDRSPLVMPCTIPIDDRRVQFELTRYLSDNWTPVIDKDVDGPNSLPLRLDNENPNLGRVSACRRVARTIFFGTAPTATAAQPGIDDRRIKLGCVMPGETAAVFGDALRRMPGQATYLYQDGTRYWFSPQPSVTSLAEQRAEQIAREPDKVAREIERRVRPVAAAASDFGRVHPFPQSSQDVPDEPDTRLVILPTSAPHARDGSPAIAAAREFLQKRGSNDRIYRNALVFLAADRTRLADLEREVQRYLAWESIVADRETLDLTPFHVRQAEEQKRNEDSAVTALLPEVFRWLLVPVQETPADDVNIEPIQLQGADGLAARAAKRLKNDSRLLTSLGGTVLRMEMDRIPLWRGDHVEVRQLVEDFARYVYLPRLKGPEVLVEAVRSGVSLLTWAQDSFAYAEGYDETAGRYRGLKAGQQIALPVDNPTGLVVKPDVAQRQLEAERAAATAVVGTPDETTGGERPQARAGSEPAAPEAPPKPRRFHGTVALDSLRIGADAGRIAEEVIAHLSSLPEAVVRATLEIDVQVPDGFPENVVRTVTENCRTLKFEAHGFERE